MDAIFGFDGFLREYNSVAGKDQGLLTCFRNMLQSGKSCADESLCIIDTYYLCYPLKNGIL